MVYSLFLGGAVISMWCYESAFAYDIILVVISLGGKLASLGGEASSLPPPVDETPGIVTFPFPIYSKHQSWVGSALQDIQNLPLLSEHEKQPTLDCSFPTLA